MKHFRVVKTKDKLSEEASDYLCSYLTWKTEPNGAVLKPCGRQAATTELYSHKMNMLAQYMHKCTRHRNQPSNLTDWDTDYAWQQVKHRIENARKP